MARKFCKVCEQEFHKIFRNVFEESIRAKELDYNRNISCTRNFLGEDNKVQSCLYRLINALIKYRESVNCSLEN